MDFIRAVINPRTALVRVPRGQRGFVGKAERTMHLNRTIQHMAKNAGDMKFDQRDTVARLMRTKRLYLLGGVEH